NPVKRASVRARRCARRARPMTAQSARGPARPRMRRGSRHPTFDRGSDRCRRAHRRWLVCITAHDIAVDEGQHTDGHRLRLGVGFERDATFAYAALTRHLDLVSFDPRGVGGSHPVRCLSSAALDRYFHTDPEPTTRTSRAKLVAASKAFADACWRRNGTFLSHVSTRDAARDMDVLRAALGDRKLTYYGASYGTFLGAKYAE